MLWCNRLWSCGWVPAGGARCRGQRPAASEWWSGSLSWCRGVEQIRLWSILSFSLMYMLFFIMVIAKIYFNDGRVQLFKSTSKLGDNHQRRETMTLAGEMNWICLTMTMTKTRNLTRLNKICRTMATTLAMTAEELNWICTTCGWRQIFWKPPLISWVILEGERARSPGIRNRKCKVPRHLSHQMT